MTYIFKLNRPNNMIKKQYAQYANKNPCMQKKNLLGDSDHPKILINRLLMNAAITISPARMA